MSYSVISPKLDSEVTNSHNSYIFDITKFSPSYSLMKIPIIPSRKVSEATPLLRMNSKPLKLPINRFSEAIKKQSEERSSATLRRDSSSNKILKLINDKKRNSDENLSQSFNEKKLKLISSYLINDKYEKIATQTSFFQKNSQDFNDIQSDEQRSCQLFHKFKKINEIASSFKLSQEIYFTPYHTDLFNKVCKKGEIFQVKETIHKLEENKRFPFELIGSKHIYFKIFTDYNDSPLQFNCNVHKGNFLAYISKKPKPNKESHEISFSNVRSCYISFDKMHEIEYVYVTIFALTDLKMSVDYYFEKIQKKNIMAKENIEKTNENYKEEENYDHFYSRTCAKKQNLIKKNKFFIKQMKVVRNQENKFKTEFFENKTNYNLEKNNIKKLFERLLRNKKNEYKEYEKNSKHSEIFYHNMFLFFARHWMIIQTLVNLSDIIHTKFKTSKRNQQELKEFTKKIVIIQRFFRHQKLKIKINPIKKIFLYSKCSSIFFTAVLKKKMKKKAKNIISNTLRASIFPINVFCYFFKVILRIIYLQTSFRVHRKNQMQRINNFKGLLDKYAFTLMNNEQTKPLFKKYENISPEIKFKQIKEFYLKKNAEFCEQMKKFYRNIRQQTKKESLALKFFAADREEDQIDSEIKSSLLVRSNMTSKKAMEEAEKARKQISMRRSQKTKKTTLIDKKAVDKPKYISEPTDEEIQNVFNLILKTYPENKTY